jgi:putative addiction module component (TIGR02574 family)
MLSADLKQQVMQLPVNDRLELIQTIVASLQTQSSTTESQQPLALSAIRHRVNQLGHDPEEPTLEELSQIVREVRQEA